MLSLHREQLIDVEEGRSRRNTRAFQTQGTRTRRRARFVDEDDEDLADAVDTEEEDLFDLDPVSSLLAPYWEQPLCSRTFTNVSNT